MFLSSSWGSAPCLQLLFSGSRFRPTRPRPTYLPGYKNAAVARNEDQMEPTLLPMKYRRQEVYDEKVKTPNTDNDLFERKVKRTDFPKRKPRPTELPSLSKFGHEYEGKLQSARNIRQRNENWFAEQTELPPGTRWKEFQSVRSPASNTRRDAAWLWRLHEGYPTILPSTDAGPARNRGTNTSYVSTSATPCGLS